MAIEQTLTTPEFIKQLPDITVSLVDQVQKIERLGRIVYKKKDHSKLWRANKELAMNLFPVKFIVERRYARDLKELVYVSGYANIALNIDHPYIVSPYSTSVPERRELFISIESPLIYCSGTQTNGVLFLPYVKTFGFEFDESKMFGPNKWEILKKL